jgi:hypothetical protein
VIAQPVAGGVDAPYGMASLEDGVSTAIAHSLMHQVAYNLAVMSTHIVWYALTMRTMWWRLKEDLVLVAMLRCSLVFWCVGLKDVTCMRYHC